MGVTQSAQAQETSIHWPGERMVGVRAHIPMDVRIIIALALMFIACLGAAAFFLYDHNQLLAILSLGLAAFLGLRLFFRW